MQILHISALPVWPMGGKGGMPSLRETLRGHLHAGHSVLLVLPRYELFEEHERICEANEEGGCEIHLAPCSWAPTFLLIRRLARRMGGGKEMPYAARWLLNLAMCMLLTASLIRSAMHLRYRDKRRFDMVYAHCEYASLAGWLIGRIFGIPNVTRLYGTFLADLSKKPLVALRYPVASAGFLVPHSLLICANDGTRGDEVAKHFRINPNRFRFWQNGVDLPKHAPSLTRDALRARFSAPSWRSESRWVVSCSRLSYWKRIDRLLYALRAARDRGCDCQLIMAGSGPEESRLRALSDALQLNGEVVWLGALEHDAIWELMHVADVFMIANDVTNRCNPLFEAIRAGLPVVSVEDPSTSDLIRHGHNALLAEKQDVESLGQHLYQVCTDDKLALSMRSAQKQQGSQLWSWQERMATEVHELETLQHLRNIPMHASSDANLPEAHPEQWREPKTT